MNTNVYQFNNQLAINIPFPALPPGQIRTEWIEEYVPGYFHELSQWVPLEVGSMEKSGRIPIFLPAETMSYLDFDVERLIEIRLRNIPGFWFPSHKRTETGYYWRVWIPRRVQEKIKLQPQTYAFAWIRGYSLPYKISRPVRRIVRNVVVEHMGVQYMPERITEDRWRWIIPETIESYPVLRNALTMNIVPTAEVNRRGNIITIDFAFSRPAGRIVSEKTTYAFRSSAVRNYTATEDTSYPLLIEIRCLYHSSTSKQFYQPENKLYNLQYHPSGVWHDGHFIDMQEALKITVYNLLQYFFQKSKPEYHYSTLSYAEHIGKVDYTTSRVDLRRRYSRILDTPPVIAPGEETHHEEAETSYPFYNAVKYIRVLNEQAYKRKNPEMYVYTDVDITAVLLKKIENSMIHGLPQEYELDQNGFLWRL